jgi:hypothetical protein
MEQQLHAADVHAGAPLLESMIRDAMPRVIQVRVIEFTPPIENWMRLSFDVRVWIGGSIIHAHITHAGFWQRWYMRTPPWLKQVIQTWFTRMRQLKMLTVAKARMAPMKEELMAAAWSPKRVERFLALGGYDMIDS